MKCENSRCLPNRNEVLISLIITCMICTLKHPLYEWRENRRESITFDTIMSVRKCTACLNFAVWKTKKILTCCYADFTF